MKIRQAEAETVLARDPARAKSRDPVGGLTGLALGRTGYLAIGASALVLDMGLAGLHLAGWLPGVGTAHIHLGEPVLLAQLALMTVAITALWLARPRSQTQTALAAEPHRDPLTGLASHREARELIERHLEDGRPFAVLAFDVRDFSRVNRALGRVTGDFLLSQVGSVLGDRFPVPALVARLEGDKFLAVLPPPVDETQAVGFGDGACATVRTPLTADDTEVHLDLCVGLAMVPRDGETYFEVLDACERALHHGKARGISATVVAEGGAGEARERLRLEADLRRAIRERQFTIVVQPQIDLGSFHVMGAEALVRWHHPERGVISPGEFIPLAESLGLVTDITEQVLELVVRHCSDWCRNSPMSLAVNLSAVDLGNDRVVAAVANALSRSGLPGCHLTLEVTETWLAGDPDAALACVQRLRALGAMIAVDDFGSGYSSLAQLTRFPIDCIKTDRAFVDGADASPPRRAMLRSIRELANALDTRLLAEGVETLAQLVMLRELGFDEAQGFFLGRPVAPSEFERLYLPRGYPPQRVSSGGKVFEALNDCVQAHAREDRHAERAHGRARP